MSAVDVLFQCPYGQVHRLAIAWGAQVDRRLLPNKPDIVYVEDDVDCSCLLPDNIEEQIERELSARHLLVLNRGYVVVR